MKPFRETDVIPAVRAAAKRHAELLEARRWVGKSAQTVSIGVPSQGGYVWPVDLHRHPDGSVSVTVVPDRAGVRRMRVLIAEDETLIRLDLRAMLEAAGFEVCGEAKTGEEAVELAAGLRPDVAILDVKMPVLDGIEASAGTLRRHDGPERVPQAVRAGLGARGRRRLHEGPARRHTGSEALEEWLSGARPYDDALRRLPDPNATSTRCRATGSPAISPPFDPPAPDLQALFHAVSASPESMDDFVSMMTGTMPVPEFFAPENAERPRFLGGA